MDALLNSSPLSPWKRNEIFSVWLHNAWKGLCFVFFLSGCEKNSPITFSEHIAPVIHQNCTPCHRPDGPGPFSLITYKDVLKKAKTIKQVVSTRYMPPWPADPYYTHFADERVLSDENISLIVQWIENGTPLGDSTKIPPPPAFPEKSLLGKPDLVLKMKKPLFVKGDNKDKFLLMKFPWDIERDTFIRAIEFVPGKKKLVHHMNGFMINYEDGKKKNAFEGEWWVDTYEYEYPAAYEKMKLAHDDGTYPALTPSVSNYLPGVLPFIYPEGIGGFSIKKKGVILLKDIHYGPRAKDDYDDSYFNIFFDSVPPKRRTKEFQLGTLGHVREIVPPLVISPDTVMTFKTKWTVPADISILTINPHMHLLGKNYLAYALTPAGDTIRLIKIPQWKFNWQYFYTFKKPVKIPLGSTIFVFGTYDNTANNPHNPFSPPRTVGEREGSMRTTDEMFQFIITYLPYQDGDENIDLEGEMKKLKNQHNKTP